ncbi:MAG: thiamine diphosphokinase [Oscillospiraceae bacterium]|nr:thiamine diphosphokinase [Oscillospiraceae bacterium]MBQ5323919.1 thiamine diphosphokinase [Oscillospiraceae bacterium]
MKRCIVIGSMPVNFDLKSIVTPDDFIFCADGGYLQAQKQGIEADVIVGDFDSAPQPQNCTAKIEKLPVIKDDTDTYHIARQVIKDGFTHAVFCGVTGGRPDHTFANIQMLKFLAQNGVNAQIMDKNSCYTVIKDGKIELPAKDNCYFSVFSLDEKCTGVSETGGFYEIENAELTNDYPIGVSNEFIGKPVTISVKKGSLLIITTGKD